MKTELNIALPIQCFTSALWDTASIIKFVMGHQRLATSGFKQVHFFKIRSEVVTELWRDPTKLIQNNQQYRQQKDGNNFSVKHTFCLCKALLFMNLWCFYAGGKSKIFKTIKKPQQHIPKNQIHSPTKKNFGICWENVYLMECLASTALFCNTKIDFSFSDLKSHSLESQEADAEAYLSVYIPVLTEKCLLGYSHAQNSKQHLQIN